MAALQAAAQAIAADYVQPTADTAQHPASHHNQQQHQEQQQQQQQRNDHQQHYNQQEQQQQQLRQHSDHQQSVAATQTKGEGGSVTALGRLHSALASLQAASKVQQEYGVCTRAGSWGQAAAAWHRHVHGLLSNEVHFCWHHHVL